MAAISKTISTNRERLSQLKTMVSEPFVMVPILGWFCGALVAVLLEQFIGLPLARAVGLARIPALFGVVIALEKPVLIPSVILYDLLIYVLPIALVARLTASPTNWVADRLFNFRSWVSVLLHIALMYLILHIWTDVSDYRLLVARLILVAVIITLSLNVINGYMGEFSCSHPGFIALGAYGASVFTVGLFVNDNILGSALLPETLGRFMFPIGLILGGVIASLGAILVAIPSFNTRGDYLAIISLAFMFMVKSLF
jgi:branched-chain amino acid transport system permease protein